MYNVINNYIDVGYKEYLFLHAKIDAQVLTMSIFYLKFVSKGVKREFYAE